MSRLYDKCHSIDCRRVNSICWNERTRQSAQAGWCGSQRSRIDHSEIDHSEGESTMTRFKLFGVAAGLSLAMAAPVMAQQAVQEPGEQAFYQSLGVGSRNSGST